MPVVESHGARISWDAQGSGTPVLLIMGHLYSAQMWYPLLPALTQRHRVITFDNRGVGDSDATGGVTIERMAADALAVLDAAGERSAHVYGVSMGGGIAAELAMSHPGRVRSLTLGCTMLKTGAGTPPWIVRALYHLPHGLLRALLLRRGTPESYGSAAPADWVARDREMLARQRWTVRGIRAQMMAIAHYATTRERARQQLTMPTLILHGDEDRAVPVQHARDLHEAIPGSTLVIFPGAGHNYPVATGGRANAVFIDFIDRVDAAQPEGSGQAAP